MIQLNNSVIGDKCNILTFETLLRVFETNADAILVTDTNNVIICANKATTEMFGYSNEEIIGHTPKLFSSGKHKSDFYEKLFQTLKEQGYWRGLLTDKKKDGTLFPVETTITAVYDNENKLTNYVAIIRDMTDRIEYEKMLQKMVYEDSLTQCYNRRYLEKYLEKLFNTNKNNITIIYFDLDDFSLINNTYGHDVGDQILTEFANRLKQIFKRQTDKICRIGGDEFVIVMNNTKKDPQLLEEYIREKFESTLNQPIILGDKQINMSMSAGAIICEKVFEPERMLKFADSLMYDIKHNGKKGLKIEKIKEGDDNVYKP